jgi:transposase
VLTWHTPIVPLAASCRWPVRKGAPARGGIAARRGKLKALVAVARSILIIVRHLLSDRGTRCRDLGSDYHASNIGKHRKARSHVRQLEALGYTVTLAAAA